MSLIRKMVIGMVQDSQAEIMKLAVELESVPVADIEDFIEEYMEALSEKHEDTGVRVAAVFRKIKERRNNV